MSDVEKQDSHAGIPDLPDPEGIFRALFEQAADGILFTDCEWRCVAVNPRGLELTGYSRLELLGMPITDLIAPEGRGGDPIRSEDLCRGGIATSERLILRKDGSCVPLEISVRMLPAGNLLGIVRDNSERRRTETALKERARELAVLHKLGVAVSSSLSLQQIASAAVHGMMEAVHPDLSFLFLLDGEQLILQDSLPLDARQELARTHHRVGECLCGLAVSERKPIYSRDIHGDARCTREECKQAGLRSFCALPLRSGDEILGVIGLASAAERDFGAETDFLETLAQQISVALANARLYEVALKEIADRKRAEEKLRESEERFKLAMEANRDGLWDWNVSTDEVYYSPAYAAMLGYSSGELPGHVNSWADLIHPEDKDAAFKANLDCIENRRNGFDVEFRMKTGNGNWCWILGRGKAVIRDACGRAVRVVGTHTDITDRKRAEAALRESERKYRELVENANSIILRWNPQGEITFLNEFGQKFFGYQEREIVGRNVVGTITPEVESTGRDLRPLMESICENPVAFEQNINENVLRDGRRVWIAWTNKTVFDTAGNLVEVLSIGTDITEKRRAAEALRESERRFRQVVEIGRAHV